MDDTFRIANAQGFWGDSADAPARLAAQQPDLDVLTLDYLAEVSMSILATRRQREPGTGYAADFIDVVDSLAPFWRASPRLKVVTNAGGLDPRACAQACIAALGRAGLRSMKIGVVAGDDVLPAIRATIQGLPISNFQFPIEEGPSFLKSEIRSRRAGTKSEISSSSASYRNLETNDPIALIQDRLVTANAYLGGRAIADALAAGCRLVVTGRVADPSLTVGPCVAHFGWSWQDWNRLAGATVAGHLIECGAQVTGGISTDWLDVPDPAHIGFPIAEVDGQGRCVITKPANTGGRVSVAGVKEQLLYEIGDPARYLSPDVTVSFLSLRAVDDGPDRVWVGGALGSPPPSTYKVSATYRAGFRAQGTLTIFGPQAREKARRCADMVLTRLRDAGHEPQQWRADCLGAGAVAPSVLQEMAPPGTPGGTAHKAGCLETVLRLSVADPRHETVERFTRELMPLVTAGPQGVTGYAEGRPRVHEVFGYWPCLIERSLVQPTLEILEV